MRRPFRIPFIALAAIAWALPVSVRAAGEPQVLYVSPVGNDAWSGKLASANAAKSDGPLASLAGARSAIRRLKAAGPALRTG